MIPLFIYLFLKLPFKAAVEFACVIFGELLHQNEFLFLRVAVSPAEPGTPASGVIYCGCLGHGHPGEVGGVCVCRGGGHISPHSYARWRGQGGE